MILMEKKFRLFVIITLSALLLEGGGTFLWMKFRRKTAYVNTEEVYNGFAMKKKLESELKQVQTIRQNELDSMRLQLDMISRQLQTRKTDTTLSQNLEIVRTEYFRKQEQFREDNQALADKYTSQIWSQLNQYMQDYGHTQGYEYIFGANGDGALMYADDAVNITSE